MFSEYRWTLLNGALQGLLLLAAHEAIARGLWPATLMPVVVAWYAVVLALPVTLELLRREGTARRRWRFMLGLGAALAALGAYTGYAEVEYDVRVAAFGLSMGAAWFILMPFAALWIRTGQFRFPWHELFDLAWGNALALALAVPFTALFWGLLGLCAGLFNVIGIHFFAELFSRREFIYPVTATVFAFAVMLGHRQSGAAATIRRVMLSIARGLLPLLALIGVTFLLFLPFTGLQPLWDTGRAAALMLVVQCAMILLLNAAWQEEGAAALSSSWVRRLVALAVCALPIYSGLTLYALFLRVAQHGWTGDRVWATLLAVVTSLFAVAYMAAAVARRERWFAPINVTLALAVLAALVTANTPLLDPMRIGAESQMNRLLSHRVAVEEFDFNYLRFEAGRYGLQALGRLSEMSGDAESAAIGTAAKEALARKERWMERRPQPSQLLAHVNLFPEGQAWDPSFVQFFSSLPDVAIYHCAAAQQDCLMLAIDLDGDKTVEYVEFYYPFRVFARGSAGWRVVGRLEAQRGWKAEELRAALVHHEWGTVRPAWPDLQVGDARFGIVTRRE